ncbi:MAG TPA: 4-hydroxy-tetrahydrodipicolinate synthase [Acidimicrobiales bacterium]|jgi:4-hydroxy-tetrahydrodipicolinate synthase|nr:4-hydroxy-tetrahydrodipicolinate synthase [Acidimicrobiales bacterium]
MTALYRQAPPFGRVITAMVTPFDDVGAIDIDGAVTLARHLAANGSDALVLTGSTGESTVLSDRERIDLWKAVAEGVEIPVIAGSTTNDTRDSIQLTEKAAVAGAKGILAMTPYYSRPPQSGIEAHFRAIAEATDLPVICYDIAIRTGRAIAPETLLRLAEDVPTIVGWKDASNNPTNTARLLTMLPETFVCYCGDDHLALSLMAVGAVGVISVASHWTGPEFAEMLRRYFGGDVDGALAIQRALYESFDFESTEETPNPMPTKAMMRVLGLPAGECRLPMVHAPGGLEDRAKRVIATLDAWRNLQRSP